LSSLKEKAAKVYAKYVVWKTKKWAAYPNKTQDKVFKKLLAKGKKTRFGKEHSFGKIINHKDFSKQVPVRDYEGLKKYIKLITDGEKDVLWPGSPIYFAKTSGTTSGEKLIPITKDSMPYHVKGSVEATMHYINETSNTSFLNKKIIFLQGSPLLEDTKGIKTGRLSGIVAHYTPSFLRKNTMPSWETNCIEDWEKKVLEISKETLKEDMAAIGGIPPWVIMYFEKLLDITGKKTIKQIFPNFSLFVYGGVNYSPYKESFRQLIGEEIDSIEYYPASEGFFAYQDSQKNKGLLLQLNSGIFYEFIEIDEMKKSSPKRLTINEVEKETNYVLVVSTNAGLWGYNTGDTVEFTSLVPARVKVTGRYKHFISAFGEHVIGSEVEKALRETLINEKTSLKEFTVAPKVNPKKGLPFHQWWIEFDQEVSSEKIKKIEKELDRNLQSLNSYYKDLVQGKVLKPLEIVVVKKGGFKSYMESIGKLGGQNKLPRLSNDRKIADQLINYIA
jgi:hypothetical protein